MKRCISYLESFEYNFYLQELAILQGVNDKDFKVRFNLNIICMEIIFINNLSKICVTFWYRFGYVSLIF